MRSPDYPFRCRGFNCRAALAGTPVSALGIAGYTLEIQGGNTLPLKSSGGGDDYSTWLGPFTFEPGADTTVTGDPDGDGMTHFAEYACGLDPSSGTSVHPISSQLN